MGASRRAGSVRLALLGASALVTGFFIAVLVTPVNVVWELVLSPEFSPELERRLRMLSDTVALSVGAAVLLVTAAAAVATWRTVREMGAGREQAAKIEADRAEAALQAEIRDQGWFVIAEFHSALAGLQGVTATIGRASIFGRIRPSVEGPLMAETFESHRRAARAVVSAQRLADTPGPWQRPASELSDLMLEAIEAVTDTHRLMAIAERAAGPLKLLQEGLPRVSLGGTVGGVATSAARPRKR